MQTRRLAASDVPVVGQGTWMMEHDENPIAALRRGLDLGLVHLDTAQMYGSGAVEEIVGRAIAGRRDEVFLVSKVLPHNASRSGTIEACESSLRRLGTDRLDLYLLHWPGAHPLAETAAAFEALRRDGKIRAYGVSNFDVDELEEAWKLCGSALACNQVLYHLRRRTIERRVLPWCEQHGVPVVAYSPLGQGSFPSVGAGNGALESVAAAHGVGRAAVALAFLLRHPSVFVIPKASRLAHVEENATAGDLELAGAEIRRIDEAFPLHGSERLPTA